MARLPSSPTLESPRPDGRTPPFQPPPTSSPSTAARIFSVAGLLLIGSWALGGGGGGGGGGRVGPLLASAAAFKGFGTPPCACRPHHPLHPQIAFCASDFVLKVRFLREIGERKGLDGQDRHYWISVLRVFRNSLRIPALKPRRRLSLWMYGTRDSCGSGITVRHYKDLPSMISRDVQLKNVYLVTGKVEHGRLMLSVCSWIAYWPNRKMRKALPAEELVSSVVTVQQARYLRHGRYNKGCSKCKIEDSPIPAAQNVTKDRAICSFDSSTDYYLCMASYSYCAHFSDPYSRTSGCEWHTASRARYGKCVTENIKLKAQRGGIVG